MALKSAPHFIRRRKTLTRALAISTTALFLVTTPVAASLAQPGDSPGNVSPAQSDSCDPVTSTATTTSATTTPTSTIAPTSTSVLCIPAGSDKPAPTASSAPAEKTPAATSAPATTTSVPSSETATTSSAPQEAPPGRKIPYTGLPTENPNETIVPGQMRSDREELPEGFTKEDADRAEIREYELQQRQSAAARGPAPGPDCQQYWPSDKWVCGAIRDKYNSLGAQFSFLLWPTSDELVNPDSFGRRQTFTNGPIYWSAATGAHPVVNSFLNRWGIYNYEAGFIGYPTTDEIVHPDFLGRRQEFQNATIYVSIPNPVGAVLSGEIRARYDSMGGYTSPELGYPMTDEIDTPAVLASAGTKMQAFQRAFLVKDPGTGIVSFAGWADYGGGSVPSPATPEDGLRQGDENGAITQRATSACPAGTTGYQYPFDAYNCVTRYQDVDDNWINLRIGRFDPNGFGQVHYQTDHGVRSRWVELMLQSSYGIPTYTELEGAGTTAEPDRYMYNIGLFADRPGSTTRDWRIVIRVVADFADTDQVSDSTQFGIVTAYCTDPNNNDTKIQFCPVMPPPYNP